MKKKTIILGIDIQNDFTCPQGALYVNGAIDDVERLANFIIKYGVKIDNVALTLDSHQPIHVAHQCYWKDTTGNHPPLYANITYNSVKNGEWTPQYNQDQALAYLEKLEAQGDSCTIWPMHCILGTEGWAIHEVLTNALSQWAITNGKSYELHYKGYAQNTEHYSIFKAAVEWEEQSETKLNTNLLEKLNAYDEVILVGEAADFCVAKSLNDILDNSSQLAKKVVVFTDCMSWIISDNKKAKEIFEKAEKMGARFTISTDYEF